MYERGGKRDKERVIETKLDDLMIQKKIPPSLNKDSSPGRRVFSSDDNLPTKQAFVQLLLEKEKRRRGCDGGKNEE